MTRVIFAALVGLTVALGPSAALSAGEGAQTAGPPSREDGARVFRTWCASCHGLSAQGNGPLAPMMRRVVPDLTQIAAANGGVFPVARVRRIIDGREVQAHGDSDMPVWGTAFRTSGGGLSEQAVRERIDALVAYLESIQKRNAH